MKNTILTLGIALLGLLTACNTGLSMMGNDMAVAQAEEAPGQPVAVSVADLQANPANIDALFQSFLQSEELDIFKRKSIKFAIVIRVIQ